MARSAAVAAERLWPCELAWERTNNSD